MSPRTVKRKKSNADAEFYNLRKNTRLKLTEAVCLADEISSCVNNKRSTLHKPKISLLLAENYDTRSSTPEFKHSQTPHVLKDSSDVSENFISHKEKYVVFSDENVCNASISSNHESEVKCGKICRTQGNIEINIDMNNGRYNSLTEDVNTENKILPLPHYKESKTSGGKSTSGVSSATNATKSTILRNFVNCTVLKIKPLQESSINVMHFIDDATRGNKCSLKLKQSVKNQLVRSLDEMRPYKIVSPFDRRVTAITWHPEIPHVMAAGSKGGEIIFWNITNSDNDLFIPGVGPGGSVCALKFHPEKPTFVYTASITGKVMLQDFYGKNSRILLDTFSFENWFCSLDILPHQKMLMTGDCNGCAYLIDPDGNMLWTNKKKLHRNKISHIEFCPGDQQLVVTASIDHSVKLWDMRMLKDSTSALHCLSHEKAVNSAYFSLINGASLLTTDQRNELRVYTGPLWDLERMIPHPHRQFQHLTPIKACWHPLEDIVVVGRYPDDNFCPGEKRAIDFFDGHSGQLLYQMWNPDISGIVSLNNFNAPADTLASGMGFHLIIWKAATEDEKSMEKLLRSFPSHSGYFDNSQTRRRQHRANRRKDQKTELKSKLSVLMKK